MALQPDIGPGKGTGQMAKADYGSYCGTPYWNPSLAEQLAELGMAWRRDEFCHQFALAIAIDSCHQDIFTRATTGLFRQGIISADQGALVKNRSIRNIRGSLLYLSPEW